MWLLENLKSHEVCMVFLSDNAALDSHSIYVPKLSKMEISYKGLLSKKSLKYVVIKKTPFTWFTMYLFLLLPYSKIPVLKGMKIFNISFQDKLTFSQC